MGATRLADLASAVGPAADVEKAYLDALSAGKKLAEKQPEQWMFRYQISAISNNIGNVARSDGRPKEAEEHYRRGIAELERLTKEQPVVPLFRRDLANTLRGLGDALADAGWQEEAVQTYERSLELWTKLAKDQPNVADHLVGKAQLSAELQLRQGKYEAAAQAADELARTPLDFASNLYNAACLLARCSSAAAKDEKLSDEKRKEFAKGYADKAVTRLKESMAKGFANVELLKKDADLEPLRERQDFKKLLKND